MRRGDIELSLLGTIPTPEHPTAVSAHVRCIGVFIQGSDTVRVREYHLGTLTCPRIIGRVTHVVASRAIVDGVVEGTNERVHPYVTTSDSTSSSILIRINWHICNDNSWPPLAATMRRAMST